MEKHIDLDALKAFFEDEIAPEELAELIDELMYHYVRLLLRAVKEDGAFWHKDTDRFIYYMKMLRDVVGRCG